MASFTRQEAPDCHRRGRPGKIQIWLTKALRQPTNDVQQQGYYYSKQRDANAD